MCFLGCRETSLCCLLSMRDPVKTKKIIILLLTITVSIIIVSCSGDNNPLESVHYNGFIKIETDKSEYIIDSASSSRFIIITGTLTNTTADTFYSELGDAYGSNFEQESLLFSEGNDGSIEYNTDGNNWVNIKQAALIEGSKVIRLSPKSSYTFQAPAFIGINQTGQYRLVVKYYKSYNEIVADTLKDKSNTFIIY